MKIKVENVDEAFSFPESLRPKTLTLDLYKMFTIIFSIYPFLKYAYILLISGVEVLLLAFGRGDVKWRRLGGMFEEIALDSVEMLVFIFWTIIVFCIIWGALWLKACKRVRWGH